MVDAGNVRDGGCRRMPLVPAMIQELVWALPPLGGARVLDLLGLTGAANDPSSSCHHGESFYVCNINPP